MTMLRGYHRILGAAAMAAVLTAGPATAQTPLPSDALQTCAVSSDEFTSWQSSTGVFNPADSATFNDATDCNFFKWGAQMFLWLTSQSGGSYVFDGPNILDVVKTASGREYVARDGSAIGAFAPRTEKEDDDTGVAQTGGSGVLISPKGGIVHYGVKVNDLYAYYQTGVESTANPANFQGDLATDFPSSVDDMNAVVSYAKSTFGVADVPASEALAMEFKTAWIDASLVDNPDDYITVEATISDFTEVTPVTWLQTGTTEGKTMALVGFHVVGSVNGHPEMVWATFEHRNNAPQNSYYYYNLQGEPTLMAYDGNGSLSWLFNAAPKTSELPVTKVVERATFKSHTVQISDKLSHTVNLILADDGQTIGPNTVVRIAPWGDVAMTSSSSVGQTYEQTSTPATRATDLVSLNSSVLGLLGSDVRANYIQTGSIWSGGGADQIPTSGTDQVLRGTLRLANTTMETFHQFPDSTGTGTFTPENCFGCHSVDTNSSPSQGVSHIFSSIAPLVPAN